MTRPVRKPSSPAPLLDRDVVVVRTADPERRKRLVRLLSIMLDTPVTPEEGEPDVEDA